MFLGRECLDTENNLRLGHQTSLTVKSQRCHLLSAEPWLNLGGQTLGGPEAHSRHQLGQGPIPHQLVVGDMPQLSNPETQVSGHIELGLKPAYIAEQRVPVQSIQTLNHFQQGH